ncbi:alpha-L-rhamnosidase [Cryobacterium glucosi]|uniref:alpha-L-rhamnosidase n=1 Tax=Cryobacterium glucosi TaxID=1259175 RepID=A0ABY2IRJ8_9MICO|nr:alpha-L-rhamnosidase [Cryobacterium glucosi]TFC21130.1 alpha-L-rhamnosidase [Cryobacterium glucosi]
MSATISQFRAEHQHRALSLGTASPRLSWQLKAQDGDAQESYEILIVRAHGEQFTTGRVESPESVLIAWPGEPLASRETAQARVRVWTESGQASEWSEALPLEASLLDPLDWRVDFISPSVTADAGIPRPAYLLRAEFDAPEGVARARIYATAHGVYELELNGAAVGTELFAPGWTSYNHRLRFQTYDVSASVVPGRNALGAWLADGWYRGRLGFNGGLWDNYGSDVSLLAQVELTLEDGSVQIVPLQEAWRFTESPITAVGLYEGEHYDARREASGFSAAGFVDDAWEHPIVLPLALFAATLESPTGPPVRVTEELVPVSTDQRTDGRLRFDFGQNIAGRLAIRASAARGTTITLHHAEVLADDELATRPLRTATAVDRYTFKGDGVEEWTPRFTYHGFRFAEIGGWVGDAEGIDVRAQVTHSDMERRGWFDSSHAMLNKLHENTVWGMRDNFVDVPTDCPQRDERLGWTGDIQVFAPAASFLFETTGTLSGWLRDVWAEQGEGGAVPNFVPWIECGFPAPPSAAWGDAAVIVPWVLYERTGDTKVLCDQYPSMKAWVDMIERLSGGTGLWNTGFQLGDWLDPAAPPENPGDSKTDKYLVSTAYFARSTDLLSRVALVLGDTDGHRVYSALHRKVKAAFQREFVSASGRVVSDTQTAISLALVFDLLEDSAQRERAGDRLAELVVAGDHRIQTGFVGTPIVCDALVQTGSLDTAYHLLLQDKFPSWLYPVTMGATTVWERWDSLLPSGELNPGEMTSFNHYALGAVIDFMHRVVAGLAPAAPGYRKILVAPQPGGGLMNASAVHDTPYGRASVSWRRDDGRLVVVAEIPNGVTAVIRLPQAGWIDREVGGGTHVFDIAFPEPQFDAEQPRVINPHANEAEAA